MFPEYPIKISPTVYSCPIKSSVHYHFKCNVQLSCNIRLLLTSGNISLIPLNEITNMKFHLTQEADQFFREFIQDIIINYCCFRSRYNGGLDQQPCFTNSQSWAGTKIKNSVIIIVKFIVVQSLQSRNRFCFPLKQQSQ